MVHRQRPLSKLSPPKENNYFNSPNHNDSFYHSLLQKQVQNKQKLQSHIDALKKQNLQQTLNISVVEQKLHQGVSKKIAVTAKASAMPAKPKLSKELERLINETLSILQSTENSAGS